MTKRKPAAGRQVGRASATKSTRKKPWSKQSLKGVSDQLSEAAGRFAGLAEKLSEADAREIHVDGSVMLDRAFDQIDFFLSNAERALTETRAAQRRAER